MRAIELSAAAGATIVNVVHREAGLRHRFIDDPPLTQQIDAMIRNLTSLIPIAEELGIVLTTESHMDYRVADYVQVMDAVASPWLRHNFDFVNSISVVEDPLDAARLAAPYTVMTHIKDMRVQPYTLIGEPRFFNAPIGEGDVPVLEILEVLQNGAPDPENLQRLSDALEDLDAHLRAGDESFPFSHDAEFLARMSVLTLTCDYGNFDVCWEPSGIAGWLRGPGPASPHGPVESRRRDDPGPLRRPG